VATAHEDVLTVASEVSPWLRVPLALSPALSDGLLILVFLEKYSIYVDTHIYMITHPYKYIYIYTNFMSTSKNISRLDLEIH
jgi:5-formaminoimidazole-4-carboxamide-1-beta-D-ribofuranosyl 5'-monophosphate synthetase